MYNVNSESQKHTILTTCTALLLCGSAAAQGPQYEFGGLILSNDAMSTSDLFSFSQQRFNFGTARSMAMGGAFTSLGADQASMVINPAGLGMYNRGEIALTPMMTFSRANTPAGLAPRAPCPPEATRKPLRDRQLRRRVQRLRRDGAGVEHKLRHRLQPAGRLQLQLRLRVRGRQPHLIHRRCPSACSSRRAAPL